MLWKQKIYDAFLSPIINSESYKIQKMVKAVLYGDSQVNGWCRIPWQSHYYPYWDKKNLFIKYENMLTSPTEECKKNLDYLGLRREKIFIQEVIQNHSFESKKNQFLREGKIKESNFMRVGKSGQWKKKLSRSQKKLFIDLLVQDLDRFSYNI